MSLIRILLCGLLLLACSRPAFSLSDQWYLGVGGGVSFLQPNPVDSIVEHNDSEVNGFHLFLGRDLGELASLQVGASSLGQVDFPGVSEVSYFELDASLLYRFYDSRDRQLVRGNFGLSLYALVGLGALDRETSPDLELQNNSVVFLKYGAGAELFLGRGVSLRLQGAVLDEDAQEVGLSLVTRFGGAQARPSAQTPTGMLTGTSPTSPVPSTENTAPVPADEPADVDFDGVDDSVDECNGSGGEFPVLKNGCPRFNGTLEGLDFIPGTAQFTADALSQLNELVRLLNEFPKARIIMLAHTDNLLDERDQAILTRERLKAIGAYLQSNGIRGKRLALRARGGASPAFDNRTAEGRDRNNRIEIEELR